MKLIHLSDLHLGKRVSEFSMLEDQEYILSQILELTAEEAPEAVVIAGDVYDKSVPPAEAVQLFDRFLYRLSGLGTQVFVISGNHDSPERIAFGGRLMEKSGIHMSPVYTGAVEPVTLRDEYGPVDIYMLPFLKPAQVRRFFPEAEIESYTDALETAIGALPLRQDRRNVLVTHQFVTGAARSDSEEVSVGGSDNVEASVFQPFDYVALGHIHGPQSVDRETLRYCGTPLKYSFSEAKHQKSITVVALLKKGTVRLRTLPLTPKRDLRELQGTYLELTAKSFYEGTCREDYLHITLTDEEDIPEVLGKLRAVYPNLMKLDYDNARTRASARLPEAGTPERRSPLELFSQFYEIQNNRPMDEAQLRLCKSLMEEIWEGNP